MATPALPTVIDARARSRAVAPLSTEQIELQLGLDVVSNLAVSTAQGLGFDPTILGGFLASDLIYEYALKEYFTDRYGAAVTDEMARSILLRGVLGTVSLWLTTRLAGDSIGAVAAAINSFTTYTVSLGISQLLRTGI